MATSDDLLAKYPIISDQVDEHDVSEVLRGLETILDRQIPGAIVEFGCYIGTTSLFIRRLLDARRENRPFHVYDSFEGLPEKSRQDDSPAGTGFQAGKLAVSKKQFIREFQKAGLKPPMIHKGWFEELSPDNVPDQIAFAFLDGDFYSSIKSSLQLVLPRMSKGGMIVIDDYAREALPGVAKAAQELHLQPTVRHGLGIIQL
jgi:O-methyltransferase